MDIFSTDTNDDNNALDTPTPVVQDNSDSQPTSAPAQAPTGQVPAQSVPSTPPNAAPPQSPSQPNGQPAAPPVPPQPAVSSQPPHPMLAKASILHSIAETLAGGPRYRTTIDPGTGTTTRERVPLSKGDIGMAIAMSAISGSLAGLQARGPNASAQAAGLGFQQVAKQRTDAEQQQAQEASAQFARQAAAANLNFRMHQSALVVGRQNFDQNQQYVNGYADTYKQLQDGFPGAIKAIVPSSELGKFNATKDNAIPVKVTERIDPATGKQVVNEYGEPQWDINYAVVDPNVKVDVPEQTRKFLADHGIPGWIASDGSPIKLPQDLQLRLGTVLDGISQAKQIRLGEDSINSWNKDVNGADAPSLSLVSMSNNDPSVRAAVKNVGKYPGMRPDQAISAMAQSKDGGERQSAGVLLSLLGGRAAVVDYARKQDAESEAAKAKATSDAKSATPEGKADLTHKQLENQKLKGEISDASAARAINPNVTPNVQNGVDTNFLASLPADTRGTVQAVGEGRAPYPTNRSKQGMALQNAVNRAYPGYDSTRSTAYQAMRKDFTSGPTSKGIAAVNTALGHLERTWDHVGYLSTLPGVSAIARTLGNEDATALNTDKGAVSEEIGKAYKAGVVSQAEHEAWLKLLDTNTPQELKGNLKELAGLLKGKLDATENQWANGMPPGVVAPIRIVSPQAARAFQKITGETVDGNPNQTNANDNANQPAKPASATQKVKGSDGNWYWVDANKNNLGKVQ